MGPASRTEASVMEWISMCSRGQGGSESNTLYDRLTQKKTCGVAAITWETTARISVRRPVVI